MPVVLVAPLVIDAIDTKGKGWLQDTIVIAQSVLVTQAVTQLTKFAVERNAPALYGGESSVDALRDRDAARSFFSAHTASAFAVSAAFTTTYWLRHPHDPARWVVLGLAAALSALTGTLKVLAGAHFWTDVAAGAAVGAGIGMLVPVLHAN